MQNGPEYEDASTPHTHWLDRVCEPFLELFFYRGVWAFLVFVVVLWVCGHQVSVGKKLFDLILPNGIYFAIAGAAGGAVGLLNDKRRFLALMAGAVAGVGAVSVLQLVYENIPEFRIRSIGAVVSVIAMTVGFLPGVAIYAIVDKCLPQPADTDRAEPVGNDAK